MAALLETVDETFEQVLLERREYIEQIAGTTSPEQLDVETLRKVLDAELPEANRTDNESYAELLDDLLNFKVTTTNQLQDILRRHRNHMLKEESTTVKSRLKDLEEGKPLVGTTPDRIGRRVYFQHVGLARSALAEEFPKFREYIQEKVKARRGARGA